MSARLTSSLLRSSKINLVPVSPAEVVGESHPHFALALMNLAAVYEATGRELEGAKLRAADDEIGLPHFLPRPKST